MKPGYSLLAGPSAAVIFGLGVGLLPLGIPGYDQVRQTVSEIGMVGSPMEIRFNLMLFAGALCVLVFGWSLGSASVRAGRSPLAGYLVACGAITWRGNLRTTRLVRLSWLLGGLLWICIALNLSVLDRDGGLWAYERPFYGLVQRSLFAVFFLWCAAAGAMLFADARRRSPAGGVTGAAGL
jgi:hypothetical protein